MRIPVRFGDRSFTSNEEHASPPLPLLAAIHIALFLGGIVFSIVLAEGRHFPSPFSSESGARDYFTQHADAVRLNAALQFGAAIPLGLFVATTVSRLRFFGVTAAGATIALFGGIAAALFGAIAALMQWTLSHAGGADPAAHAIHLMQFATGGIGQVVTFGLFVAGISVSGVLSGHMPRWILMFGLAIAAVAGLSWLSLLYSPLFWLLPIARFGSMIWLVGVAVLLPRSEVSLDRDTVPSSPPDLTHAHAR